MKERERRRKRERKRWRRRGREGRRKKEREREGKREKERESERKREKEREREGKRERKQILKLSIKIKFSLQTNIIDIVAGYHIYFSGSVSSSCLTTLHSYCGGSPTTSRIILRSPVSLALKAPFIPCFLNPFL